MALISCPECEGQVSELAIACPKCGYPIKDVQTIQATGKNWKKRQAFGMLFASIGMIFFIFSAKFFFTVPPEKWGFMMKYGGIEVFNGVLLILATLFGGVGFLFYFISRIGGWWHHG